MTAGEMRRCMSRAPTAAPATSCGCVLLRSRQFWCLEKRWMGTAHHFQASMECVTTGERLLFALIRPKNACCLKQSGRQ